MWHVVRIYAAQGFRRFVLLTGHKSEAVRAVRRAADWPAGVSVECVFTGEDTPTGGRVHRARDRVGDTTFALTYADGVADIDLAAELAHHRAPRRPGHDGGGPARAAVRRHRDRRRTTASPASTRSRARTTGSTAASSSWSPRCSATWTTRACWSASRWRALAADGELHVWRHTGFWECLDTHKDAVTLNDLWAGDAPWKVWD